VYGLEVKRIGITGFLLKWCESFLYNRKQKSCFGRERRIWNDRIWEWKDILSCCKLGLGLGHSWVSFFVIFLNDLILSFTITSEVYADDCKLTSINKKNDNIQ
jgi:hypothetical protein